jgi:hypothetical protein
LKWENPFSPFGHNMFVYFFHIWLYITSSILKNNTIDLSCSSTKYCIIGLTCNWLDLIMGCVGLWASHHWFWICLSNRYIAYCVITCSLSRPTSNLCLFWLKKTSLMANQTSPYINIENNQKIPKGIHCQYVSREKTLKLQSSYQI